jgi:predicted aminopeptidase
MPVLTGCYVTRQAWHQGKLLTSRRDIKEVITDKETPPAVRERLDDLTGILNFAKSCGLEPGDSYRKYIDNGDKPVSWLVYAAQPDRLESVTWWFPFAGRVPYLGFFSRSERDEEEKKLRNQGYDTARGAATAFSMLGLIPDPLYRSMTRRSRDEFAHLIFHELVHRTVWIKGSVGFNERLAEVFSRRVTMAWLDSVHDQKAAEAFAIEIKDRQEFGKWLRVLRGELEKTYSSGQPRGEILRRKAEVFTRYTVSGRPTFKGGDLVGGRQWNNAEVLAAGLYDGDDFPCSPEPISAIRAREIIAWLVANKDAGIANTETLRKACL